MYKVAICDEDAKICQQINDILTEYAKKADVEMVIDIFQNGSQLLFHFEQHQLNLIYLEIQMDIVSGIEVGYKIRNDFFDDSVQIVYISAIKDYSMELFPIRPNDFLVKPLEKEQIIQTLETAIRLSNYKERTFNFNIKGKKCRQKINEIIYFESNQHKIKMVTKKETFEFYGKLSEIYQQLKDDGFGFCHNSYLVNIGHIIEYNKTDIKMCDDTIIKISRGRNKEFIEQMTNYENPIGGKKRIK